MYGITFIKLFFPPKVHALGEHWGSENHPSSFHFSTLWNSNRRQLSERAGISQQEASCSYLLLQHSEGSESVSRQCESNGHRGEGYRSGLLSECQTIRLWGEYKKNYHDDGETCTEKRPGIRGRGSKMGCAACPFISFIQIHF